MKLGIFLIAYCLFWYVGGAFLPQEVHEGLIGWTALGLGVWGVVRIVVFIVKRKKG